MTRSHFPWTLGLPAALLVGAGAALGGGVERGPDLKGIVAVVDMERMQAGYAPAVEREAAWNTARDQVDRELAKMQQHITALKMEADAFEKGTAEHDDALIEVQVARQRYDLEGEKRAAQLQRRRAEFIREISRDLRAGISRFAREKGYQLVLRQRSSAIGLRGQVESDFVEDILFSDDGLDVTDQIIQFLKVAAPEAAAAGK